MNLMAFLNAGVKASGLQQRADAAVAEATEKSRQQWLQALGSDEIRTWLNVGESSVSTLRGASVTLTLAAYCKVHEDGHESAPAVRVIRGAISAIESCITHNNCEISASDARAISAAIEHAKAAIKAASHQSIQRAAISMRALVSLDQ